VLLALAAALVAVPPAHAQADWYGPGALAASDPTYWRVYLDTGGQCLMSSVGSSVYYDIHELVLAEPAAPTDLIVSLCNTTAFDSVAYLYQFADGHPGPFNPANPCARLVAYSDDICGAQSQVSSLALVPGHVQFVVTSFANGTTGAYVALGFSAGSPLEDFIFYSGFETFDLRTWSSAVN
jgi:hypothetical protein